MKPERIARISILLFLFAVFPISLPAQSALVSGAPSLDSDTGLISDAGGYDSLDALLDRNEEMIEQYRSGKADPAEWERIARAIDAAARQKDAWASRLFWHTDLDKALAESARTKKPVLTLRLLGGLDEEYSCANSRFFRSVLYTDPGISRFLRDNYVLHWQSVRPAPKMTIDFGDGRRITRTVTGNSIHYVLDSEGRVVEALPGLYSPSVFLDYLEKARRLIREGKADPASLSRYWASSLEDLERKWRRDSGGSGPAPAAIAPSRNEAASPRALEAAPLAVTKSVVEAPALRRMDLSRKAPPNEFLLDTYRAVAMGREPVSLSEKSADFVRLKSGFDGEGFRTLRARLEEVIAIDTVQNEHRFHTAIYSMLLGAPGKDVDILNEQVYRDLFLTPREDRWLGLYAPDVYAALDGNGVVER